MTSTGSRSRPSSTWGTRDSLADRYSSMRGARVNSFQPRINFVVGVWRVQHELQVGAKKPYARHHGHAQGRLAVRARLRHSVCRLTASSDANPRRMPASEAAQARSRWVFGCTWFRGCSGPPEAGPAEAIGIASSAAAAPRPRPRPRRPHPAPREVEAA